MATSNANKTKSSSSTKASSRKPTASRSARASSAPRRNANGRFRSNPAIPGWAATVASIVGVGVAVGAGLYATRRQWLPQAERWGDQIASRFRHDDDEFYGDTMADHDDDEIWDEDERVSRAAFPDRDLYPGAQQVS